jgi:glycine/sarcosine N-methyltransferase
LPSEVPLYDSFSDTYDIMVSWRDRLERESPFFERALETGGARRVLDLACGTGMHAIHFAQMGCDVVGADPSLPMIQKARMHAVSGGVANVDFIQAGFGELRNAVQGMFDVVTCLGNSLPHVRGLEDLRSALYDVAAVLKVGGLFIVQQLNYDRIMSEGRRFLGVSAGTDGSDEMLFFRFYDLGSLPLTFNVVRFRKHQSTWDYRVDSTDLFPIRKIDLDTLLPQAGFDELLYQGDYQGAAFDAGTSSDLIFTATLSDPSWAVAGQKR